jgi:transcriptional regulator with XRE-family HTH domain
VQAISGDRRSSQPRPPQAGQGREPCDRETFSAPSLLSGSQSGRGDSLIAEWRFSVYSRRLSTSKREPPPDSGIEGEVSADDLLRRKVRVLLRKARERRGMSQLLFPKGLGPTLGHPISPSQISDWERGRREPGATVLLAAADLAGGSIDSLRSTGTSTPAERLAEVEERIESLDELLDELREGGAARSLPVSSGLRLRSNVLHQRILSTWSAG